MTATPDPCLNAALHRAAAEAHRRAGNAPSARYYRQLRARLIAGQPE